MLSGELGPDRKQTGDAGSHETISVKAQVSYRCWCQEERAGKRTTQVSGGHAGWWVPPPQHLSSILITDGWQHTNLWSWLTFTYVACKDQLMSLNGTLMRSVYG